MPCDMYPWSFESGSLSYSTDTRHRSSNKFILNTILFNHKQQIHRPQSQCSWGTGHCISCIVLVAPDKNMAFFVNHCLFLRHNSFVGKELCQMAECLMSNSRPGRAWSWLSDRG